MDLLFTTKDILSEDSETMYVFMSTQRFHMLSDSYSNL